MLGCPLPKGQPQNTCHRDEAGVVGYDDPPTYLLHPGWQPGSSLLPPPGRYSGRWEGPPVGTQLFQGGFLGN